MRLRIFGLISALAVIPSTAFGWDTHVNSKDDWKSIYETEQARFCATASYHPGAEKQPDDLSTHGGGNEHAEIADDTLWVIDPDLRAKLGINGEYGLSGEKPWLFVDLNATFRRHFKFENTEVMRDDETTVFEERALGDLVRYAGIPDFNYTIYDWINKSTVCPSIPANLPGAEKTKIRYDLCHLYTMWKGAAFNSSHFGALASKMWVRHHEIAYKLAGEAREMREAFGEEGMVFHEDFVKEGELMALMYEIAGQHFLQDRWSTGHMFARWGPGGWENLPRDRTTGDLSLPALLAAGMFTGIVHGSEAIFGFPDPVASPFIDENIGDDAIIESAWSYSEVNPLWQDTVRQTGVGDYRFGDLVDLKFDGQPVCSRRPQADQKPLIKPEALLTSRNQNKAIRHCTSMALRRVIAEFGNTSGEQYGALDIKLTEPDGVQQTLILPAPGSTKLGLDLSKPGTDEYKVCHDAWLTNDTYYRGYMTIFGTGGLLPGKDIWVTAKNLIAAASAPSEGPTPPAVRVLAHHTLIQWEAHRKKESDEQRAKNKGQSLVVYGTDTAKNGFTLAFGARNGLGEMSFEPNSNYPVPLYVEPVDLDTLPADQNEENDTGRTQWAVHGFFNRAKAQYWCDGGPSDEAYLQDYVDHIRKNTEHVRDEPRQKELATCAYLATRLYKQTDPAYSEDGARFERIGDHMPYGETAYGPDFEPVCFYLDPLMSKEYEDEESLYHIHPGFVEEPGTEAMWDVGAPDGEKRGLAPQTLQNWCNRIPVIDFLNDDPDYPDKVAEVGRDRTNGFRWAKLEGANIGMKTLTTVGSVQAAPSGTPDDGTEWVDLNVWDQDVMMAASTGWSLDNTSLSPQIPGALAGFPSSVAAAPMLAPHFIKYALPQIYDIRMQQPDDEEGVELFQSEGKSTVGLYELLVYPSFEESVGDNFASPLEKKAFFATWPDWSRNSTEVLAMGLFIVTPDPMNPGQDIYTAVAAAPITQTVMNGRFEFDGNNDPMFIADDDQVGILLESPGGFSAELTGNTIAWVFAFH